MKLSSWALSWSDDLSSFSSLLLPCVYKSYRPWFLGDTFPSRLALHTSTLLPCSWTMWQSPPPPSSVWTWSPCFIHRVLLPLQKSQALGFVLYGACPRRTEKFCFSQSWQGLSSLLLPSTSMAMKMGFKTILFFHLFTLTHGNPCFCWHSRTPPFTLQTKESVAWPLKLWCLGPSWPNLA